MDWGSLMEGGMNPKGRFGLRHFNTKSFLSNSSPPPPHLSFPPPPML